MDDLKTRIQASKAQLDRLRLLAPDLLGQVQKHFDVELTYTSNAIEGNTLTLRKTAEVIEHGITVGGKKLRDHLEAADHYDAIQWVRSQVDAKAPLGELTVGELHRRIVARSDPNIAGSYSQYPRRIAGSNVVFPNPRKVPDLMERFGGALASLPRTPEGAFDAHYRLVAIHLFADGNGRTARLLMNLLLLRAGYPPVAVRPEDRAEYLQSFEHASLTGDLDRFQRLLHSRLADTLSNYVGLFHEADLDERSLAAQAAFLNRGRGR